MDTAFNNYRDFNPRLREGGDRYTDNIQRASVHFNPRLREGGDICKAWKPVSHTLFQSTPPRGRRHYVIDNTGVTTKISIHASAREATAPPGDTDDALNISIHASAREATCSCCRRGHVAVISIHASAREATALITKIHLKHHISFQHTVHKSPFNVNYPFQ